MAICLGAVWATLFGLGTNLAHGKAVKMSSSCKIRPEYSWQNLLPARLVDGKKWRYYDICTDSTAEPWVSIDLGASGWIDEVIVTGRRDCCWGARDLPLVFELSDDGSKFAEVARRVLPFSDRQPWRLSVAHLKGRYLRLRVAASGSAQIVLSEVEVYGALDSD